MMTSVEIELRAEMMAMKNVMVLLLGDLREAVADTDPESEASELMERLTIVFNKYSATIEARKWSISQVTKP